MIIIFFVPRKSIVMSPFMLMFFWTVSMTSTDGFIWNFFFTGELAIWFLLKSNPPQVLCTLLSFSAPLEGFFWDASTPSKWVPLMISLSLFFFCVEGSHMEQDQVTREVVLVQQCSSQLGTVGCSGCCKQLHCCSEATTIYPATTLITSCTMNEGSPCRLSDWSSDLVARTCHGPSSSHWRTWSTWLRLLTLPCFL